MFDEHIRALCEKHDIERAIRPGRGHARVKHRTIQHPPLMNLRAYFVALHEVGHIMVGLGPSRLEREAAAWEWALAHSLYEADLAIRQMICACLWRYLVRAQENAWPIPAPSSTYWELMAWWV